MTLSGGTWGVSTTGGLVADHDVLLSVLESHQDRLLEQWRGRTHDEWDRPTRNPHWSVHETARHVADAMERGASAADGADELDSLQGFDPRSTPLEWLVASAGETPAETCARYEAAAGRFRDGVGSRLAAGDTARANTVFGDAHWSVNVVHILWDSWIHERDVLLPADERQTCSAEEERLVGLYGVFIAGVPSKLLGIDLTAIVELVGQNDAVLEVRCDGGQLSCQEVRDAPIQASGDHGPVIDALSGRGLSVEEALPGAPDALALLAAHMNS